MLESKEIRDVCAALIEENNKFLVARRKASDSFAGLWEFPGGSVEPYEGKEECLKREIKEEINVEIRVGGLAYSFEDEIPSLKIKVFLFNCKILKGTPQPVDCQEVRWVNINELAKLKLAQADKKILLWLVKDADKGKT